MLAVRCALLAALLAAPGAAQAPRGCPRLGKSFARTCGAGPPGRRGVGGGDRRAAPGSERGVRAPQVPAGTGEGSR